MIMYYNSTSEDVLLLEGVRFLQGMGQLEQGRLFLDLIHLEEA